MLKHLLLALAAAAFSGAAGAQTLKPIAGSEKPGALVYSEQFLLRSEKIGQTYLIQVSKPVVPLKPGETAPVIYASDGMLTFGLVTSAMRAMLGEALVPSGYVVAIGYPEDETAETTNLRLRDLMHKQVKHQRLGTMQGGGGAAFEDFLLNEVKPLIEKRYAVDSKRSVLLGFSVGGLFTASVLAHHPEAFSGYVIGSPSMHYDEALPDAIRKVGARGLGRRVFIGVGELEAQMIPRADVLEQALAGSTFAVSRKTFAGETHTSEIGALVSHGLRWVFATPKP